MGVKKIIVFDGDKFEESNLNRQRFCDMFNMGYNKASASVCDMSVINNDIDYVAVNEYFGTQEHVDMLIENKVDFIFHCADNGTMTKELYDALNVLHIVYDIPIIRLCIYINMVAAVFMENRHIGLYLDMKNNSIRQFMDKGGNTSVIVNTSHINALAAGLGIEIFLARLRNPAMESTCLAYHFDGMHMTRTDYIPYLE